MMKHTKEPSIAKIAAHIRLSDASLVAWHEADEDGYDEELLFQHDIYEGEVLSKCG